MGTHPIGVHVGPGLTEEGELLDGGPLGLAAEMDADGVQVFLADPQGWTAPKPRPDAEALLGGDVMVVVHAPYVLNVATTNNRIRIPSRKLLDKHALAAAAVGAATAAGAISTDAATTPTQERVATASPRRAVRRIRPDAIFSVPPRADDRCWSVSPVACTNEDVTHAIRVNLNSQAN